MLLSFPFHKEKINGISAGLPVCPLCLHTKRVHHSHSQAATSSSHGCLTNLLLIHLLPSFSPTSNFGFICFDSVQACSHCSSHSCISTRVCDRQQCRSSIRLQGVCWESQGSLRIYVLHQIIVTDTTLPASKFGNIRISPIASVPRTPSLERAN